mmetsp:Transcript_26247/g.66162  ORF Transcript_26247/g.66162 Transcript_26247/m.66162 type:complete len:362 (-) Transcript_26247:1362-2447(-)
MFFFVGRGGVTVSVALRFIWLRRRGSRARVIGIHQCRSRPRRYRLVARVVIRDHDPSFPILPLHAHVLRRFFFQQALLLVRSDPDTPGRAQIRLLEGFGCEGRVQHLVPQQLRVEFLQLLLTKVDEGFVLSGHFFSVDVHRLRLVILLLLFRRAHLLVVTYFDVALLIAGEDVDVAAVLFFIKIAETELPHLFSAVELHLRLSLASPSSSFLRQQRVCAFVLQQQRVQVGLFLLWIRSCCRIIKGSVLQLVSVFLDNLVPVFLDNHVQLLRQLGEVHIIFSRAGLSSCPRRKQFYPAELVLGPLDEGAGEHRTASWCGAHARRKLVGAALVRRSLSFFLLVPPGLPVRVRGATTTGSIFVG